MVVIKVYWPYIQEKFSSQFELLIHLLCLWEILEILRIDVALAAPGLWLNLVCDPHKTKQHCGTKHRLLWHSHTRMAASMQCVEEIV